MTSGQLIRAISVVSRSEAVHEAMGFWTAAFRGSSI